MSAPAEEAPRARHVETRLIAETTSVVPGGSLTVALRQIIAPGWHTYWVNPGDAGEPTHIDWALPPGFGASEILWPAPQRLAVGRLMNFGYENRAALITTIAVPKDLAPGQMVTLKADASWLVCAQVCVPEDGRFALTVPVTAGPAEPDPLWAADFLRAREALPQVFTGRAFVEQDGDGLRLTVTGGALPAHVTGAAFFPFAPGRIRNAAPQKLSAEPGAVSLSIPAGRSATKNAALSGVLVIEDGARRTGLILTATPLPARSALPLSIPAALLFAFLGGLILNLMPCVFPVLSMKTLMVLEQARIDPRPARTQGLAYGLGVVLSFVAIASVLLMLRHAGAAVGWGFQFQSPLLVALMALLFFAIALNLAGLYEVSFLQSAGSGQGGHGFAGAFLTGVLAVAAASPCTAPFMAAAIGLGFAAPVPVTLAIFAGLGLGMAAPFTILSLSPALLRLLPKPGRWMGRLKLWLALPMALACLWLVWVLDQQTGLKGAGLWVLGAAGLGLALWAWGRAQAGGAVSRMSLGGGVLLALAALAVIGALPMGVPASVKTESAGVLKSLPYSPARLAALRGLGQPVFVNLTAAWCITCRVNEALALSSRRIAAAFEARHVTYLKGDWTLRDPEITQLLEAYGRDGVPLYLYFAPGAARATLLPQILTEADVMDALSAAAPSAAAALPPS